MLDLHGKVAIVTGGTKGIGLAIVNDLLQAGASVTFFARTPGEVTRLAQALEPVGPDRILGVAGDVSDPAACQELVDRTVERFGALHILINNAGVGIIKPIQEMSVEEWQLQIDVNLGGVFYCSKAALSHLQMAEGAWIINIGSLASRNTFSGGTGYNASKFGLLGMTEAMMLDVRYDGIRTSIVMPGSVDTYFGGHEPSPESTWKIQSSDVSRAVLDLLAFPGNAHPSRIEIRPSQPGRK